MDRNTASLLDDDSDDDDEINSLSPDEPDMNDFSYAQPQCALTNKHFQEIANSCAGGNRGPKRDSLL
eukprot:10020764-Ditylum_brightwellii.AAC.1